MMELNFQTVIKNVCVQDLMGGSEIKAALCKVAMISINLALLLRRYKYIQRISFGFFSARSQVLDSISYSMSLMHLSWMPQCAGYQHR